jgi:DNA-binding NtrC family response regulator
MTYRVLILVSDPLDAPAVKKAIEQDERVSVVTVSNPMQMQRVVQSGPVDVIVMDLEMRKRDWPKLLKKLHEEYPDCLVLVRTAHGSLPSAVEALRAGAFDYIVKPCTPEQISTQVARALLQLESTRARNEAEKKKLLHQLAVGINHEINNPLTAIMGTAELILAERKGLDKKIQHDLRTIVDQCVRIREVTAHLRELPKIHTTTYAASETMLDLHPPEAREREREAKRRSYTRRRVLVVDDNELMVSMLGRMFENEFEIAGCGSGAQALVTLAAGKVPDIVLVEMVLPDTEGADLVREIRRLHPFLPVILLAGYHDEESISRARQNGAAGLLYKPIHSEEFRKTVLDTAGPVPPTANHEPPQGR